MASLFKPKVVVYRLPDGSNRTPDGKRVTKDTPGAVRTVEESAKWYGRFNVKGKKYRVPLSESKDQARRMLRKKMGDAEMGSVGLKDPFAKHRDRPLLDHLEDFTQVLTALGRTAIHVQQTTAQCRAIIEGCQFRTIDDMNADAVIRFLANLRADRPAPFKCRQEWYTVAELAAFIDVDPDSIRRMTKRGLLVSDDSGRDRRWHRDVVAALQKKRSRGIGVETSNHYLTSIKAFSKWLFTGERTDRDFMVRLKRQNANVDVRHPRRALPEKQFFQFIEATGAGETYRGLSGTDRLVLYTLAANTGFRASELASLTPASFSVNAAPFTVTVQAGYSKHKRKDVQSLRPDVAAMMKQYLEGKPRGEPVWPGTWSNAGAEIIRVDLEAAGIPYQDDSDRFFDFHALRGQFISFLAAGGVHPKVAQVLARHSTITLTMDSYTHLDLFDVAGALDKMPGIAGSKKDDAEDEKEKRSA